MKIMIKICSVLEDKWYLFTWYEGLNVPSRFRGEQGHIEGRAKCKACVVCGVESFLGT